MENKKQLDRKEKTTKQNRIWIRIASACNVKCVFCLDSDAQNGTFPDPEKVLQQLRDGYKEGYENRAIISGGEASINPKFSQYVAYAKELGYDRVQTVTNGNMFARKEFCDKLITAGLEEVTFSFHGHTANLHDALVDAPGAFQKALKGLINLRKFHPQVIINIDIVVCKPNVKFLPDIVQFFMRLGVYEFDILQIIPFGRGFADNKSKLFYNPSDYAPELTRTWRLSRVPGMYLWTNRFPAECFEGFEDLIQDPRKMKSETMGEAFDTFEKFIFSHGKDTPPCFGERCDVCFQKQYCHDYRDHQNTKVLDISHDDEVIEGKEFPSEVYESYGDTIPDFKRYLKEKIDAGKRLIDIPKCLGGSGIYRRYNDVKEELSLADYTYKYINSLYRKKSLRCVDCKHNTDCEGIHINFIRSYGFRILEIIPKES